MRGIRLRRELVLLLLGALMIATVACGPAQSTAQASATVKPATPTVPLTATSQPTATTGPAGRLTSSVYRCQPPANDASVYTYLGDLRVTKVSYGMAYPSVVLTHVTPDTPYRISLPASQDLSSIGLPANPVLDGDGNGYQLYICNTSKTSMHILRGMTVTLAQFTAQSGPVAAWQVCDGYYQRPLGVSGGGCGGAYQGDEWLRATFPATGTTGASAVAAQVGTPVIPVTDNAQPAPPLPVALGPGQGIDININVVPPTATGWYTFSFALSFDGHTPAHISTMPQVLLHAQVQKWDGKGCTTTAMQALIPASNTTAMYLCPATM